MVNKYNEHIPEDILKELVDYGMSYDEDKIPTYGEVFDWFTGEKNLIIIIEPFFTYALNDNIAYTWKIYYPDFELGGLVVKKEGDIDIYNGGFYGGSFLHTANAAIKYAMTIVVNTKEQKEVNHENN